MIHKHNDLPLLSFGVATDTHYADRDPVLVRQYRLGVKRMKAFALHMNDLQVDFAIHLGDFKDQDEQPDPVKTLSYLQSVEQAYSHFSGPRYHVVGNHDVDSIDKQTFLAHVENSGIPQYKSYYSFDVNGVHCVVLDANYTHEGQDHFQDFNWQLAHIPSFELEWLKDDLASTSFPTLVFVHQLLFDAEREFVAHIQQSPLIRKVLEDSGKVLAVFMGHIHQELYRHLGGIHYCVLPAMAEQVGDDANAYARVQVWPDHRINIQGFGGVRGRDLSA